MDSDSLFGEIKRSRIHDADIQICLLEQDVKTIKIENSRFTGEERKQISSLVIECIYKGKEATFRLNGRSNLDIQGAIKKTYNLAKLFGSSDNQKHFYISNKKLIQKTVIRKENFDVSSVMKSVNSIKKEKTVYSVNSFLSHQIAAFSVANDSGSRADFQSQIAGMESEVISRDGNEQGSGTEFSEARNINDLNITGNLDSAVKMAKSMLNARPAPTVYGKLLLDPKASIDFVNNLFDAMNGEEILKKRSFLSKFRGKQIASKIFNIYDLRFLGGSLYNRNFDDELVATTDKYLVKRGVFVNYLNDIYSAEKLNEKPKGNNFSLTTGGIRPVNAIIKKGKDSLLDLVGEVDKGIYLVNTGDAPNMLTGDVSSMVSIGYYIENGEIKYPVKETLIGGNMLDMLKNIIKVGSNVKNINGVYAPPLLIDNVKISGR